MSAYKCLIINADSLNNNLLSFSNYYLLMDAYYKYLKGALCSSKEEIQTQNFYIYSINEVIAQSHKYIYFFHNWINKLFSEETKNPWTLWYKTLPVHWTY